MIKKNVSGQGVYLYAINNAVTPAVGKTGDAANITGSRSADSGAEAALATLNPTEIGGGVYWHPLTQAETNGDMLAIRWTSTTASVTIEPRFLETTSGILPTTGQVPTAAQAADAVLGRNVDGGVDGGNTVSQALQYLRNSWQISGSTLTVYKSDGTTVSWTTPIDVTDSSSLAAIKAKTDNLPANPAAVSDVPLAVTVADAVLGRSIDGGASGGRTVSEALHLLRNKWTSDGGVLTVYRSDDTTVSWTSALVTSQSNPVTASDPN